MEVKNTQYPAIILCFLAIVLYSLATQVNIAHKYYVNHYQKLYILDKSKCIMAIKNAKGANNELQMLKSISTLMLEMVKYLSLLS